MSLIDEPTARKFLELLHSHAAAALSHIRRPGVLQLVSVSPDDRGLTTSAFNVGDVNSMLDAAFDQRQGRLQRLCRGAISAPRPPG